MQNGDVFFLDAFVQGGGFGCGWDSQFLFEDTPAGLVLSQSIAPLSHPGKQVHGGAVRLFTPGFQTDLFPSVFEGSGQVAAPFVEGGEGNVGAHGLLMQAFTGQDNPFFECVTVLGWEASQEITSVIGQKFFLSAQARQAVVRTAVQVPFTGMVKGLDRAYIGPDRALRMKLNILGADEQKFIAAERLFEVGKCLTQTLTGTLIVLVGPQQSSQTLAPMRMRTFDRQKRQQRTRFICGKSIEMYTVAFYVKGAEEGY
jgi:hypothetical protein